MYKSVSKHVHQVFETRFHQPREKKSIWRVTSPGTRRYYNLSVIYVCTIELHNTFFSGNFSSLQTLWWYMLITHLYWCHYETVNSVQNHSAADAIRTRPAFSLRALMEVWKTILCLVHATEGKHLQPRAVQVWCITPLQASTTTGTDPFFGSLEGPFMWGACDHESKLFESILLGGPTNWLGQHNPTNIKWAEHHQRPDNQRFQKNASFVCQSSKNGDTPSDKYIRTRFKKKDPGIFWCESQLTFQHLMPGPRLHRHIPQLCDDTVPRTVSGVGRIPRKCWLQFKKHPGDHQKSWVCFFLGCVFPKMLQSPTKERRTTIFFHGQVEVKSMKPELLSGDPWFQALASDVPERTLGCLVKIVLTFLIHKLFSPWRKWYPILPTDLTVSPHFWTESQEINQFLNDWLIEVSLEIALTFSCVQSSSIPPHRLSPLPSRSCGPLIG